MRVGVAAFFWPEWIRSSMFGWLGGLLLVVGLAVVGDLVRSGEGESQLIVGVGIGLGVGIAQRRVLRAWLGGSRGWTVASVVGMSALFALHDLGPMIAGLVFPFSLPVYVVAGGLTTGIWQGVLLRRVSTRALWWPLASTLGWGAPALLLVLADSASGPVGSIASLSAIFLGGGVVGAVSGGPLRWILAGSPPRESPAVPAPEAL